MTADQLSLGISAAAPRLPSDLRPMLPRAADEPFDDAAWLFEPSWDGLRALAHVEAGRLRLVDRVGREIGARFPELLGLIDAVVGTPTVLDGEVAAIDADGMPDPEGLRARVRPGAAGRARGGRRGVTYLADDLVFWEGRSLLREPLARRRAMLDGALHPAGHVVVVPAIAGDGLMLFEAAERQGLPAMLARRADSPYLPGVRSDLWRLIHTTRRFAAVVGGYAPRPDGSLSLLLGAWERSAGGEERFVAVGSVEAAPESNRGSALERALRRLEEPTTPFRRGARAQYRWVRPELVVSVAHSGWSEGRLAAPTLAGLREDLDARDCHVPPAPPALSESGEPRRPVLALLQRLPLGEE